MMLRAVVVWFLLALAAFALMHCVLYLLGFVPPGPSPEDDRVSFYIAAGVFVACSSALLGAYT